MPLVCQNLVKGDGIDVHYFLYFPQKIQPSQLNEKVYGKSFGPNVETKFCQSK